MRHLRNIEDNVADIKDLTTIPPMTAERHAAITRKKIKQRRLAEDVRDAVDLDLPIFKSTNTLGLK